MQLTVTGRHLAVTESTREQIAGRTRRLERLLNDRAVSAQCVVSQERQGFTCDLTVHVGGGHALHGLGRAPKLVTAVGLAVEKVAQQATRLTGKQVTRRRPGGRSRPESREASRPEPRADPRPERAGAPARPRVIRAHGYDIKPMSVDDAVLALSESDRAFLVFRHATSERMAILFRRPDGHFGLVEPEK